MRAPVFHIPLLFFCIPLLLIPPKETYGQQAGLKLYNVSDGLPGTETFGAYQDKYGYLWVGTPDGVSRFDGRQFVNYSIADGLPSLKTSKIFQDSRERLWIGTDASMAQFKNNRFITYPTSDGFNNTFVFNIIETKEKRVWALTVKGVYEFADSIWKKIALYPGFDNEPCRNIIETNDELYVNYPMDIVCRNKDGKWAHIASSKDYSSIFNVMSERNGEIWISTISNIYVIRNRGLLPIYKRGISIQNFFSYLVDSKRRLWIGGENLLKISIPGDWTHFSPFRSNLFNYCYSISEDSSRNIWIGTTAGLLKLKDISLTIIDKIKNSPLDGIFNMVTLPGNKLLLSSGTKGGLMVLDNDKSKQILPPHSPGNQKYYKDPVDAYTFDKSNTLWMVTRFRKFLRFSGNTLKDYSQALHLKTTESIYDMEYVKNRNQFFICADSTLLYGSCSKLSTFIPRNTGVPIIKPTRVHMVKNGLLLLYLDGRGVYCIDEANNLTSLIHETGIDGSKKGIELGICFHEDADNNFWISIPGLGLYEYGFTKSRMPFLKNRITIKDGLQSNDVTSLTNDRRNRLWVATNTGVDILQTNQAGNCEVFNFAKSEELTINTDAYTRLMTDRKGNVWLCSPNKVIKFDSANIRLVKEPPRIIIEKVSLAFQETDWSKFADSLYSYYQLPYNPVLSYTQNSLGISFNATDLSTSNSFPEYSYKLLPLDSSWSIPSKIKSVSFAQLPKGNYQFMVRAKDRASGWSKAAVFRFTITPPFWDKWWFRSIIIAIASFIIVGIFRYRIRKIRQDVLLENQLRELEMKALKAQMNPHFIYNALNSIQALVANDKKAEGIHYIGSFSRLLRQVLDNSEKNVISLDKELESIGLYIQLEALRLDMQLQYIKIVPKDLVTEFEKVPPLILQPFVENALWHGLSRKEGEKEIKITVSATDDWFYCDITDNGIGRAQAQAWKSRSAGLHESKAIEITRKRLIDFNQDISVSPIQFFDLYDDKQNPAGTRVTVRIRRKSGFQSA